MIIKNAAGVEYVLVPAHADGHMIAVARQYDTHAGATFEGRYAAMIAAAPAFGEPHPDVVEELAKAALARRFGPGAVLLFRMPSIATKKERELAASKVDEAKLDAHAVLRKLLGR